MSQRNQNQRPQNQPPINLTEDVIKSFLENQKAQLFNEAEQLKLKSKEIEINGKLAEKSLEIQASLMAKNPGEGRKTLTRFGYVVGGLCVIFFAFVAYCLYLGRESFIIGFLKQAGYVATTALGFYFGRKSNKGDNSKKSDTIEDVEVVEE